ncbi:hypothetical protein [Polyangium sp. 6x1]|uniref:hypothetical protein n=1 Tax=Polyangium sp. 6x1 TaxID=3042689 RepID=UPI0024825CA0|nr:hypothetical protein [Polyangium sp. 6x1]MDI1444347.1 hypothetical protein [Polyangium sp. 6x1]
MARTYWYQSPSPSASSVDRAPAIRRMVARAGNFVPDGLFAYDFDADKILGSMPVTEAPDHISTSPKGNYCVPSWGLPLGTRADKTDCSSYTQLHDNTQHSDLAITKNGDEVLVYTAYGENSGNVVMVELAGGRQRGPDEGIVRLDLGEHDGERRRELPDPGARLRPSLTRLCHLHPQLRDAPLLPGRWPRCRTIRRRRIRSLRPGARRPVSGWLWRPCRGLCAEHHACAVATTAKQHRSPLHNDDSLA